MKKLYAAVTAALLSTLIALPAEAGYTPTYYNPGEDGGCNAAAYFEDWSGNESYTWNIPALADGESIDVGADKYWWNNSGYYFLPADQYYSPKATFTCNNGTISGGGNGYWAGN
ncbi:hypothetical protein ACLB1G_03525 [Oxalobacteraceae bacterium A2-2]